MKFLMSWDLIQRRSETCVFTTTTEWVGFGRVARVACAEYMLGAEVLLHPKSCEPPDGNISTVGAKCFRSAEVLLQPKTSEPPENISTVCAKRFRCGEVLVLTDDRVGLSRSVIFLFVFVFFDAVGNLHVEWDPGI